MKKPHNLNPLDLNGFTDNITTTTPAFVPRIFVYETPITGDEDWEGYDMYPTTPLHITPHDEQTTLTHTTLPPTLDLDYDSDTEEVEAPQDHRTGYRSILFTPTEEYLNPEDETLEQGIIYPVITLEMYRDPAPQNTTNSRQVERNYETSNDITTHNLDSVTTLLGLTENFITNESYTLYVAFSACCVS
jgi:hypothetical protein